MTTPSFIEDIEVRDVQIAGESDWHWIKSDVGGFGDRTDGPMRDWLDGHSYKYFKYLRDTDTIVTGGGCCGMHIRFYAKRFKTVIAFEPDPRSFHCMVNNAPYDNVIKLNAAIGRESGMTRIGRRSEQNIGMNGIDPNGPILVPILPIDSLRLHACSLIQLDVEGYEHEALLGALETIQKFKPVIVAERYRNDTFMQSLGYQFADTSFMDNIYVPVH